MSDSTERPAGQAGPSSTLAGDCGVRRSGWKPVLTLLLLSPAVGELLSGSSPPLQFFNPLFLLILVGLYGCGVLLVRETVARRNLNATGVLLLGAAYGIAEEGLMCKSFFNPYWTDTGYLSVYGRAWGVNWVWAFGLTAYHMVVSICVPVFLTEALFPSRAREVWLRQRGWRIASLSLALVVVLGFIAFDNRQFHLIEMKDTLGLARRLNAPAGPLDEFVSRQLTAKNRKLVDHAAAAGVDSPELRHALQEEFNRLLPRSDLHTPDRFAGVNLLEGLKGQDTKPPRGDKLVEFNRALLERAYPEMLATRQVYPFRPGAWLTLGSLVVVTGLVLLALRQTRLPDAPQFVRRPWLSGLSFTAAFILVGFVLPGLVEHGARISPVVDCGLWCVVAVLLGHLLRRMDACADRLWRRGLWAVGVLTPWVFWALLLGIVVGMNGAKSFAGMAVVALGFGSAILLLVLKWRRRLETQTNMAAGPTGKPRLFLS